MMDNLSGTFSYLSAILWLPPVSAFVYEVFKVTPYQPSSATALSELEVNMQTVCATKALCIRNTFGSLITSEIGTIIFFILTM